MRCFGVANLNRPGLLRIIETTLAIRLTFSWEPRGTRGVSARTISSLIVELPPSQPLTSAWRGYFGKYIGIKEDAVLH